MKTIASILLLTICFCKTLSAAEQPNILFILVDDFGSRDLSCYGSELYETPQMDQIAREGAIFTQAYVTYPRCVPSRFSILTGKLPGPFQKNRDSVHIEPARDITFGQPFQEAGYTTFYCGKWHLGDGESVPSRVGFSKSVAAGAAGATRSHFAPYDQTANGKGEKEAIEGLEDAPEGEYLADRLTEETMQFIEEYKDGPFLAVLAHYAVHTPIEAKKHLTKRYAQKLEQMELPDKLFESESAGENLLVQNNPTYAAMIESVDHGVGRLLRLLKRLKIDDNTIVVLASDHGGLSARGGKREVATSNRPYRAGKGHLYEGGLRIPFIIKWPGRIKPAQTIDEPVLSTDLFPTFLELAGLPLQPDAHRDGVSLATLLTTGEVPTPRTFFWHNPAPRPSSTADMFSSAIRQGRWKLVDFPNAQGPELYDLSQDIEEAHNLATQHPDVRDELLLKLRSWRTKIGATDQPRLRKKERGRKN